MFGFPMTEIAAFVVVVVSMVPNAVEWKDFAERKNRSRWIAEEKIPAKVC